MHEPEVGSQHHDVAEFSDAIEQLDEVGWHRLIRLARNRCLSTNPGDEQELLHEALKRVLEGRRPWPRGLGLRSSSAVS